MKSKSSKTHSHSAYCDQKQFIHCGFNLWWIFIITLRTFNDFNLYMVLFFNNISPQFSGYLLKNNKKCNALLTLKWRVNDMSVRIESIQLIFYMFNYFLQHSIQRIYFPNATPIRALANHKYWTKFHECANNFTLIYHLNRKSIVWINKRNWVKE